MRPQFRIAIGRIGNWQPLRAGDPRPSIDAASDRSSLEPSVQGSQLVSMMVRPFGADQPLARSLSYAASQRLLEAVPRRHGGLPVRAEVDRLDRHIHRPLSAASSALAWPVVQAAIGLLPDWGASLLGLRNRPVRDAVLVRPAATLMLAGARAAIGTSSPMRRGLDRTRAAEPVRA